MACYAPISGRRTAEGKVTLRGVDGYYDKVIKVSCGQCIGCRIDRQRDWTARCLHEASQHEQNAFLTLTYNKASLPENGHLKVKDWQDFAKRLRKNVGPFRYFHCGEYGDDGRPHYHALLFGLDFSEDRYLWKQQSKNKPTYRSETLERNWKLGFSTLGDVTHASAAYVAKYIIKRKTGDQVEEHYRRINYETGEEYQLTQEYTTMSRRPGIGTGWIQKFHKEIYPSDFIVVENKKLRPPKFYDKWMGAQEQAGQGRLQHPLTGRLAQAVEKRRDQGRRHQKDKTHERLKVRETIAEAKQKISRNNKEKY